VLILLDWHNQLSVDFAGLILIIFLVAFLANIFISKSGHLL